MHSFYEGKQNLSIKSWVENADFDKVYKNDSTSVCRTDLKMEKDLMALNSISICIYLTNIYGTCITCQVPEAHKTCLYLRPFS